MAPKFHALSYRGSFCTFWDLMTSLDPRVWSDQYSSFFHEQRGRERERESERETRRKTERITLGMGNIMTLSMMRVNIFTKNNIDSGEHKMNSSEIASLVRWFHRSVIVPRDNLNCLSVCVIYIMKHSFSSIKLMEICNISGLSWRFEYLVRPSWLHAIWRVYMMML